MKHARKLTALLAVIALLCTLWTPLAVSAVTPVAQQEDFYFGRSILAKMKNSDALLYAYDKLVAGCETASTSIDIAHRTHQINSNEASLVRDLVFNDHPEFFWLTKMSLKVASGVITTFVPTVPGNVDALRAALNARVAELTADLTGKSDYEKSLILHDRLANANTYQYTDNDQTVIGSLLEGKSVCAGYARGYQLLMQAVGIPTFIVSGHSKGEPHAWNLVRLDGEWYYTDVTWDDQNDDGGRIYYAYLNTTFARMEEDHTAVDFAEYLPHATATANNYHVVNNSLMATPNADRIAALTKQHGYARVYVTGDMQTFIDGLSDVLSDVVVKIIGVPCGYSCSMEYMGRELILNLTISHTHRYETVTVAATCTVDGSVTTKCKDCGVIESIVILPATGEHDYTVLFIEPTCTVAGKRTYSCSVCGDSYSEAVAAKGHNEVADAAVDATCGKSGLTAGSHCGTCGEILTAQTVIPATDEHDYTVQSIEPTCTVEGKHTYTCTVCGDSYSETVAAKGHNEVADAAVDATCGKSGLTAGSHCGTCGEILTAQTVIPATGEHDYDDDQDAVCNVCGYERPMATVIPGDANGDGKVNNRDLGLLQQYLNDRNPDNFVREAADLNGDGKVNNRDLGLLQKALNA